MNKSPTHYRSWNIVSPSQYWRKDGSNTRLKEENNQCGRDDHEEEVVAVVVVAVAVIIMVEVGATEADPEKITKGSLHVTAIAAFKI